MGRHAKGDEHVAAAYEAIAAAKTVEQLRMAQAVVLPLQGLSVTETARILGISPGWVSKLRGQFIGGKRLEADEAPRGGRFHSYQTPPEEAEFLKPYGEAAETGGVLVVPPLKAEWEKRLGHSIALSTVYRMLHRHGWRKLAPDKRHPKADAAAQEQWKKNSPSGSPRWSTTGKPKDRSG
jgi:transposase